MTSAPTEADPVEVEDLAFIEAVRAHNGDGVLCAYADASFGTNINTPQ